MQDFDVGERLRLMRVAAGLSQRQLADAAGVPHGQVSMIETNRSSPSVASLRRILTGLKVTMSEFFAPDAQLNQPVFFRPEEMRDMSHAFYATLDDARGRIVARQVGDAKAHHLQIVTLRFDAGADTGERFMDNQVHEGGMVLAGSLEITIGAQSKILEAGESFLFATNMPHRMRNITPREAVVVIAANPPYL